MAYFYQRENIKACPGCGTNLIKTAKHCAVCGFSFTGDGQAPPREASPQEPQDYRLRPRPLAPPRKQPKPLRALMIPLMLGTLALMLAFNVLVTLGFEHRGRARAQLAALQATATYIATTYVSPTPVPTATNTPGPPTPTPIVYVEYTVAPGDSCISIADRFDIYVDALLLKNDIDCAQLTIGTLLRIPPPEPTPTPDLTTTPEALPGP